MTGEGSGLKMATVKKVKKSSVEIAGSGVAAGASPGQKPTAVEYILSNHQGMDEKDAKLKRKVIALLDELKEKCKENDGASMVVTIEHPKFHPIIRVTVTGVEAFMRLVGGLQDLKLQDLKLQDRLEHRNGPDNGVDAAFYWPVEAEAV